MSTGESDTPRPDPQGGQGQPSEEEVRAAYEAEIKKIRVEQILLEQVVTLINLGMRKTGLAPGTEDERDLEQVRMAIEAIRVQMPLVEQVAAPQAGAVRDALSQLQLAFVRLGGSPGQAGAAAGAGVPGAGPGGGGPGAGPGGGPPAGPGGGAPGGPPGGPPPGGQSPPAGPGSAPPRGPGADPSQPDGKPGEGGPAQRSGRLWIPGQ